MPNHDCPRKRHIKLALILSASSLILGTTCPSGTGTGGTGFPKSTAWTQQVIDDSAGVTPAAVTIADFDADGVDDVAVAYAGVDTTPARFVIFYRSSDNMFTAVPLLGTSESIPVTTEIVAADMNGDSRLDLVAATDEGILYLVSPADPRTGGDWTGFILANSGTDTSIGTWRSVAVGDIDGANGPDIVAAGGMVGRVSWFRSPAADVSGGDGWTRVDIDTTTRTDARSVALLDLSGDDRLDVVSTAPGENSDRLAWYQNPADPANDTWTKFAIGNLAAAGKLAIGDLDVDGLEDVIAINRPGRQVGWYKRPADATQAWMGFQIAQYDSASPVDMLVTDVDGNSQPDLVVATEQPGSLRWFTPVSVQTDIWTENNLVDLNETVTGIAAADFDADGRPDVTALLLAADASGDNISWFENPEP